MRPSSSAPVSARTIGQQAMFAFTTSRTILTTLTRAMVYMLTEYCKSEFEQCVPVVGLWLTMEASGIRANYSIKGSTMLFGWTLSLSLRCLSQCVVRLLLFWFLCVTAHPGQHRGRFCHPTIFCSFVVELPTTVAAFQFPSFGISNDTMDVFCRFVAAGREEGWMEIVTCRMAPGHANIRGRWTTANFPSFFVKGWHCT